MEFSPLLLGTAFALVLPAELPDKTMVATLLLATRYRPGPVLLGVSAAFAVQCLIAVAFGSVLTLLPDRAVALVACLMFAAGAVLLLRHSAGDEPGPDLAEASAPAPWWRIGALSFGVLFAAEWGDASQFATAALTACYGDPLSVGLGAWLALLTVATLAVGVGKGFALRLPIRWLSRIAGVVFACFAVLAAVAAVVG
ncbi:MAG TPA: TMEM165/GDT1 family protein [Pseudonocardiaceae bacterium]|nr:TMEM165/GDT1 family protein [Pseudonocardiaceae bacterium]